MPRRDITALALRLLAALQLAQGALMVLAPRTFFDQIGPFGAYNDHYIRDAATWSLALGVVFLVAAARPRWRPPVLLFAAVQFGLHTLNHLVDIGDAAKTGVGVFDFVSLGALTALFVVLLRRTTKEEGS
jgi:hypothetical protein